MKNFPLSFIFRFASHLHSLSAMGIAGMITVFLIFSPAVMTGTNVSPGSRPEFTVVPESNGIAMPGITTLVLDDDGFVWAASRMGIMRATLADSRHYDLPLSTPDAMQLKLAYNKGVLAASTQSGQIFRYNRVKDRFDKWFTLAGKLGNREWVTNLVVDAKGRVWVSTSVGVFIYSGDELKKIKTQSEGYSYVTPLVGEDMFGIIDGAPYKINAEALSLVRLPGEFKPYVSAAAYDSYGKRVWLGTYQGELWDYSLPAGSFKRAEVPGLPVSIVRSIMVPDSTTLFMGMEGGGLVTLDPTCNRLKQVVKDDIDNPTSLKGNSVFAILFDGQGRLWTATTSGGLQYAEPASEEIEHLVHRYNDPASLHNNEVNYLMHDDRGRLWIGTNDGISRRDDRDGKWMHLFGGKGISVLALTQDRAGRVYATTFGKGVYVLDGETGQELRHFTETSADIFGNGAFVFAAFTDSDGDVWFGGAKGDVVCYSPATDSFRKYEQHPVFCFVQLAHGVVLAGGGDGLMSIEKATGKTKMLLRGNVVQDVVPDGNILWICTSGNGVIRLDLTTGEQMHLTTGQGLHSNFARSIIRSGDDLWISTARGLSCYSLRENRVVPLPGKDLFTRTAFRENASCDMADGRIAFGTNNGVVTLHPGKVRDMKPQGKIYFSDIRVSGRSIRADREPELTVPIDSLMELRLNYPRNSFTLSVLPLGNVSSNVSYSWQLEGQDKTWSELSPVSFINYINLRPGKYTLRVRMYDGGVISERALKVSVKPPFWQTGWFRGLIVLVVIAIAGLLVRHYIWRMRRRYTMEKIRFYTRMAHDLRTSLMLIKSALGELRKEDTLTDWGEKCLGIATDQTDRLTSTATHLLDFEKADIGAGQPNYEATDLVAMLRQRVAAFESFGAAKGVTFSLITNCDEYATAVDRIMIDRIIDNLLSNAVKYSEKGGRVEVTFDGDEHNWRLKVKDNGIGIPAAELKKLFKEFYRAENAVNSQIIGSGLGLLSVKRYVDIHSGEIKVKSTYGEGTVFKLRVPRRLPEPDAPSSPASAPDVVVSEVEKDREASVTGVPESSEEMVVLIVEDNAQLREFLVGALQGRFKVETSTDGLEAWEKMETLQPDLVLTDVMMPGMDGFELCRLIKSTYATSHIPVIILTALEDKESQMRGLGLGADNYLVKPFDMELLAQRIRSIIQNRRSVAAKALENVATFQPEEGEATVEPQAAIVENVMNDEFLKRAVECVKENITNEAFGKGDFAAALMISQSLLYKKIKSLTDMSVVEFIRSIRLNHAMSLLQTGKYNVTEVSEMCGFSSSAYFSRVFKESFGKSPSEVIP